MRIYFDQLGSSTCREWRAYSNDDRKPELSLDEEVGSMTEERLDDGRVQCVKERTRCELPTIISSFDAQRGADSLLCSSKRSILAKVLNKEEAGEPLISQLMDRGTVRGS
jgi:hypothetical protein